MVGLSKTRKSSIVISALAVLFIFMKTAAANSCEPGADLNPDEKNELLSSLEKTETGKKLIESFVERYGSIEKLKIQWDHVSYSQIMRESQSKSRSIASTNSKPAESKDLVCIHLTKKLPDIEHTADLAHEITHAVRLENHVLRGDVDSVDEFVKERIAGIGGEADAFATECMVKREVLGNFDALCSPYAADETKMDQDRVVDALYSGTLSASLTGETYPIMLAKQFNNALARKASSSKK